MALSFAGVMMGPSKEVFTIYTGGSEMEQREMDNLEKVVQLVDKTGCSYVDAKRAL